jgi:hypothetical protein
VVDAQAQADRLISALQLMAAGDGDGARSARAAAADEALQLRRLLDDGAARDGRSAVNSTVELHLMWPPAVGLPYEHIIPYWSM